MISAGQVVNAAAGTITLDGGGAAIQLNNSNLTTTNSGAAAVTIRDGAAVTLGNITAAAGTVQIGVGGDVSGAVVQTPGTTLTASTLAASTGNSINLGSAGTLTIANLGTVDRGGALTINDSSGDLTVTGNITGGTTSNTVSISTTGALALGASDVSATTLTLNGVGVAQTSGTLTVSGTTTVNAGSGSIGLLSASNDFAAAVGSVVLTATGGQAAIRDVNDLGMAAPTLGAATGFTAIAGANLNLPAGPITTTGSIDLRSLGGALATPGVLTATNIALTGASGLTIANNLNATNVSLNTTDAAITESAGAVITASRGDDFQCRFRHGHARSGQYPGQHRRHRRHGQRHRGERQRRGSRCHERHQPDGCHDPGQCAGDAERAAQRVRHDDDQHHRRRHRDAGRHGQQLRQLRRDCGRGERQRRQRDRPRCDQRSQPRRRHQRRQQRRDPGRSAQRHRRHDDQRRQRRDHPRRARTRSAASARPAARSPSPTAARSRSTRSMPTSLTLNTAAGNGNITQNAAAIVSGATTANAGSGAVTLTNPGNNFGSVAAVGGAVSVTDVSGLTLGAITATSLTVNTAAGNGAVTQSGAAVVSGASTVNAGSGAITLANAGNDFSNLPGNSFTGGAISLRDANDLTVTTLAAGANQSISVVAGLGLSLPGNVSTGGGDLTLSSGAVLTTPGILSGRQHLSHRHGRREHRQRRHCQPRPQPRHEQQPRQPDRRSDRLERSAARRPSPPAAAR